MEPAGSRANVLERRLGRQSRSTRRAPLSNGPKEHKQHLFATTAAAMRSALVAKSDPAYGAGVAKELKHEPLPEDRFRGSRTTDPAKP